MKLSELIRKYRDEQQRFWREFRVQRIIHGQQRDLSDLYQEVHQVARPIFVLSTGRVGTKLLTSLLERSRNLMPVHEPVPELTYHSILAFREPSGSEALKMAIDLARYEYIRNTYLANKRYVETNNRITFFAYYLAELYPKAIFIHIVRNPADFIRSGIERDWYSGKGLFDEGRIIDSVVFKDFNQPQKIAWLWAQTNRFVEDFGKAYPKRCFFLKAEDLFTDSNKVMETLDKLEIGDISKLAIEKAIRVKVNQGKKSVTKYSWSNLKDIRYFDELKSYYDYE